MFDTFWNFAAERQSIYSRRLSAQGSPPWTSDPILADHRFTNAYRAVDRTSQYLIRRVIYEGSQQADDVIFRILLFKLFNKVATWEALERSLGPLESRTFHVGTYANVLGRVASTSSPVYSGAYIMPPPRGVPGSRKFVQHLNLLDLMLRSGIARKVARARSLDQLFDSILPFPGIGPFLAYQFAIDINYSEVTDFPEESFVVPGPGARDGIAKCFSDRAFMSETDVVMLVAARQADEFESRGLAFRSLWGRPLMPVDCQNLFCELDKYARLAHPKAKGRTHRTKIKRRFNPSGPLERPWFPPKWGLNARVAATSI